jgi:drug/metabolite transporter (DMT)-like permease
MSLTVPATSDRTLPGVALMVAFCVVAPLIDVAAKLAAASVPVGQITAIRFLLQALLMAPILVLLGHSFSIGRRALGLTFLRAVFLVVSTFSFVSAVAVMPLADALAIIFVEPFILLLLGWAIYSEAVGPRRILAACVGFLGAVLVIQPGIALFGPVALYPLVTALSFAAYMLVTRSLSREMHPVPMQFHTALLGFAICLPILLVARGGDMEALQTVWPQDNAWLWLAGVGLAATVSHMAITYALKYAPAATLAPLHYLEIVSAVFFGYVVFGDFPTTTTLAGIALIVASGLYVIHRERVLARQIRAQVR